MRRSWIFAAACACAWGGATCATAGDFSGPGGMALRVPDGWAEAPADARYRALELARSGTPGEANRVEVVAMFLDPNDAAGRAAITVLATEGGLAVNDDSIRYAQRSIAHA